jgi:hypothetical protein
MRVFANWQLPVFQILGPVVRVHWDYEYKEIQEDNNNIDLEDSSISSTWSVEEVAIPLDADRETFIRIVSEEGGPAEELADEWFSKNKI